MRARWMTSLFATGCIAFVGCGGGDDGGGTTPDDTGTATETAVDTGTDATKPDIGTDTGTDTGTETATDIGTDADAGPLPTRTTLTNGSAVAITKDDKFAVACNRTAGTVSIFALKFGDATAPLTKETTLAVGAEPWDVVIGNDDDTAYIIVRADQKVVKITNLHGTPSLAATTAKTGAEPTGIAISPTGAKLYVANWSEGTVSVINTKDMSVGTPIDLNAALAAGGMLGTVTGRPGLAHPRSLVVTNNGDASDADETIYVSEFFSQAKTTALTDDSQFDNNRQGVIYQVNAGTGAVGALITIAPVLDTGFKDSKGAVAGCFPNQLYAVALNKGDKQRLYVTANCESPRGPTGLDTAFVAPGTATSNFKTEVFSAVFVVDTATSAEVPAQGLILPKKFSDLYDTKGIDDASTDPAVLTKRRNPLILNDIAFATGTNFAYVTAYGSDAVFRIAYNADGSLKEVGGGTSDQNFINLSVPVSGAPSGSLPIGIASANAGVSTVPFALVINENTRNLSEIGFSAQNVLAAVASDVPPPDSDPGKYDKTANTGKKFFVTGLARWSFKGQAWNSCESCHPDGLTDNVTWYFGRGPRQTTSLDGTYDPKDPTKRRILNWTAIFDEVHDFELNTRGNSGGLGAIVHQVGTPPSADDRIIFDGSALTGAQKATTPPRQDGLNGSVVSMMPGGATTPNTVLADWNNIDAFVKFIRAPKAPTNLDPAKVAAGLTLFKANNCANCHGGSQWTISRVFWTPSDATNNVSTGSLLTTDYVTPSGYPALNPPLVDGAGKAKLRFSKAGVFDPANDQINCILRDVGTYPTAAFTAAPYAGVTPTGVAVDEVRTNMTAQSQGKSGFNIPSLLGMVSGAPYFHGGNARTLEELFSSTFTKHYQAHATVFTPSADQIAQLVAFLSSIDESTTKVDASTLSFATDLCPAAFP